MDIRQIRFRVSGGFAGLVRGTELAGADLSAPERRALESHLRAGTAARDPRARDAQVYEIDASTSDGPRQIRFDDMNVPDDLQDLIDRLTAASRPVRD